MKEWEAKKYTKILEEKKIMKKGKRKKWERCRKQSKASGNEKCRMRDRKLFMDYIAAKHLYVLAWLSAYLVKETGGRRKGEREGR